MGMGYDKIGDAAVGAFMFLLGACALMFPLAIWKLIEIVIWIFEHVSIGLK